MTSKIADKATPRPNVTCCIIFDGAVALLISTTSLHERLVTNRSEFDDAGRVLRCDPPGHAADDVESSARMKTLAPPVNLRPVVCPLALLVVHRGFSSGALGFAHRSLCLSSVRARVALCRSARSLP
jgi:hypothetical protein